jgi:hypothetical protein
MSASSSTKTRTFSLWSTGTTPRWRSLAAKAFSSVGARPPASHAMTLDTVGLRVGDELQIVKNHHRIGESKRVTAAS